MDDVADTAEQIMKLGTTPPDKSSAKVMGWKKLVTEARDTMFELNGTLKSMPGVASGEVSNNHIGNSEVQRFSPLQVRYLSEVLTRIDSSCRWKTCHRARKVRFTSCELHRQRQIKPGTDFGWFYRRSGQLSKDFRLLN